MAWAVELRDRLLILELVFEIYQTKDNAGNLGQLEARLHVLRRVQNSIFMAQCPRFAASRDIALNVS